MLSIKVKNISSNPLPEYKTLYSSGMDLRAFLKEAVCIKPRERAIIETGIFIEIPENYEAQIRSRSGLAAEHGISVLNSPGTIDADYRGEIKVILINLSDRDYFINNGDRIAQIVFSRVERVNWQTCNNLQNTERGKQGFGHTGKD